MPQTSPERLTRALETPTGGVFFLFGEEAYLRGEMEQRIVGAHLDPATRDFNLDLLRGAEVPPEQVASLIATPPMMAEWRIVVVRDAQHLAPKARDVVEQAAASPLPGLVLVISAAIPSGSKARFYANLKSQATSAEFPALDVSDAPGWLMERALLHHQLEMDGDAARALAAASGTDLGVLAAELQKLADFVRGRPRIGLDDVRAVSVHVPRVDRWGWFDAVAERNFAAAGAALPALLESGESAVGLIIGISAQLLRVALVLAGGPAALERELKPYQRWMSRRIVPQANRWTLPELERALGELLRSDRLLKSASLSDRQAMEELLLRLRVIAPARSQAA